MTDHDFRRLPHVGPTRHSIERDVDDEMRFHIQARIEDLMRQGKSRGDAESTALREYGDLAAARSELASIDRRRARQGAWREWLGSLGQDIRFGIRGLRSRPAFTITVLLTIALGVGANAAIFSVVDSVLLRPLPFAQPNRLVHLWETYEGKVDQRSEASYPDYLDWRARNAVFSDLAGYHGGGFLLGSTQPSTVVGGKVTANFFDVLGVHAIVGRTFAANEDAVGAARVVLLTYGFWQREFGGDRTVAGRPITLDGAQATIVGVLPESFRFGLFGDAQIVVPIDRAQGGRINRGNHWLKVVGRLRDGVELPAAGRNMSAIMHDLAKEYPPTNAGRDGLVVRLHDEMVGSVRPVLLLLYGAVVVVLLIACVNVANLLLIRGADRHREIAVRVALGAGKSRLIRQLLTESVLLAGCGGVLGLGVAKLGVQALLGILPARQMRGFPTLTAISLDSRIVVYALLVSLAAGVGFGIVPALRITRLALNDALRSAGRGAIGGGGRLRDGLVMGEIALTVILMSGALLFGRSLMRLLAVDPGFRAEHAVTTTVLLPPAKYNMAGPQLEFFHRFVDGVRQLPGVQSVGLVSKLPLDFGNSLGFEIVGRPESAPGYMPTASYRQVSTDYFRALGIPLVSGRVFGSGDDAKAPSVGVINRALASTYFHDQDPVGQGLIVGRDTLRVVGVVGDVPIGNIDDKIPPTLYLSFDKNPQTSMSVVTRTTADPVQVARAIRGVVSAIDPAAALTPASTMDELITQSPSVFTRRFPLYVVGAFALTALLLAVVGIYGVVSYSVAQRTREMGIRMALGAQPRSLLTLVMRQGGSMAAIGIIAGVVLAVTLGRFAEKLLYGVQSTDPLTYVCVVAVLAAVAVGATILPARRATRVDPARALRAD
jgi:putative ABC transport system permease protein